MLVQESQRPETNSLPQGRLPCRHREPNPFPHSSRFVLCPKLSSACSSCDMRQIIFTFQVRAAGFYGIVALQIQHLKYVLGLK